MTPRTVLWVAGTLCAAFGAAFAWFVRLPLPFDGFAVIVAGVLAFWGTVSVLAWMPIGWLWTDAERLRYAFRGRHGISDDAADVALGAITTAHERANTLRGAARVMRDDVAERVKTAADRLDSAAHEIFYAPQQQRELRAIVIRSELIEDAATAHAKLRAREHRLTEDASREKLVAALDALEAAFDQTDLLTARGLLSEVEVASEVAESLLKPASRDRDRPVT
jgi:hypothetical protein